MLLVTSFHLLLDLYGQFKENVHKLFPHLYDTKHVAFNLRKVTVEKDVLEFNENGISTMQTNLRLYKNNETLEVLRVCFRCLFW